MPSTAPRNLEVNREVRYGVVRLIDELLGDANVVLFGVFAVALLVLLIACSTAGSLVGIRFERRGAELAVRRALGADSARIVKDAVCELVLLAVLAAGGGVLVAQLMVLALRPLAAQSLPRADGIAIDAATLLFAAGATAATVLLTGAVSLSTLLKNPGARLRAGASQLVEGGRRTASVAGGRGRHGGGRACRGARAVDQLDSAARRGPRLSHQQRRCAEPGLSPPARRRRESGSAIGYWPPCAPSPASPTRRP